MNALEWVAAHDDGVPRALAVRMLSAVAGERASGGAAVADELAGGAERLMRSALGASPMTRAQALDVLGADALLTYAFEAAADEPQQLAARADAAMLRVAALDQELP